MMKCHVNNPADIGDNIVGQEFTPNNRDIQKIILESMDNVQESRKSLYMYTEKKIMNGCSENSFPHQSLAKIESSP